MPDIRIEVLDDLNGRRELVDRLVEIWTDVSNAGGAVGFVPPVTRDDIQEVAVPAFNSIGKGDHLVVAYDGQEPIGFCFLEHRPGPLFKHWVTVKRLQVHPSLQGKGYGARILELIHEQGKARLGLEQIQLTVRGGTGTETFYERLGYEVVARIPGIIRVAPGDDRDEIVMVKRLVD